MIKSSFLATVQDYGRLGFAKLGISRSGVADEHAFCWANRLLNNHFNDAAIEVTFGGLILEAKASTQVIVTGADLGFKINGIKQVLWQVLSVRPGDVLSWETAQSPYGFRAYLAVKGGFQSTETLLSRSVTLRENIGKPLQAGDTIKYFTDVVPVKITSIPWSYYPNYQPPVSLRVVTSYQYEQFDQQQKKTFFNQSYKIDSASDRTGCRLKGKPLENVPAKMVSEGIAYGSIELTTEGLPIILLKEAPTIGGYPKIATVFSLDLAKLAQCQAGANVVFKLIDFAKAQTLRKQFNQYFGMPF